METILVWIIVGTAGVWVFLKFSRNLRSVGSGRGGSGCPSCSAKGCCAANQNHTSEHPCGHVVEIRK